MQLQIYLDADVGAVLAGSQPKPFRGNILSCFFLVPWFLEEEEVAAKCGTARFFYMLIDTVQSELIWIELSLE